MMNQLDNKIIIWNGDSICAGKGFDDTKELDAWAGRIAAMHSGVTYKNYAVGGGTVAENSPAFASGKRRHSVSETLAQMHEEFPNADYILFEGGTNDADLFTENEMPERLGSMDITDFSGNYDRDTFCGALESIFYRATSYWKGKKIAYIVAHKMGCDAAGYTAELSHRRAYFEAAIGICRKWGIPYLDLWDVCYLNPKLPWMYDRSKNGMENATAGSLYADGQHLTAAGYDLTAGIIHSWLLTL